MEFQITYESSFGGLGFDQFLLQGYCGQQAAASKATFLKTSTSTEIVAGKKKGSPLKSAEALKSHSDAEKRRRERINAHLSTLRGLVPSSTDKMDKAAILAEVITQVQKLKKQAKDAAKGLIIPSDHDDVRVQPFNNNQVQNTTLHFKASICCNYRPDLLSDLKQALNGLQLRTEQSEMSMLGGRVKNEFVFSVPKDGTLLKSDAQAALASSIHCALTSVLEKSVPLVAYSPLTAAMSKKRKLS